MKKVKQFITKCYNEDNDNYCWYNTSKYLNTAELQELREYFNKKDYNFMLIINGCSQLRPQRTWFCLPTFLKGIDGSHTIYKSHSNAFILCSWLKDYKSDVTSYGEDIIELLSDIPYDLETIIFRK